MLPVLASILSMIVGGDTASTAVDFDRDVRPIFARHCVACHDSSTAEAELNLTSEAAVRAGSRTGKVVYPGSSNESYLLHVLQPDHQPHMPPDGQLSSTEIQAIRHWIDSLGPLKEETNEHWAFVPIRVERSPATDDAERSHVIDDVVEQARKQRNLHTVGPADPLDWLRRVTFDLTGLPPSPEEIAEFERDHSEAAYGRVVDRLLSSKRHGEHAARAWLDLVRYADSDGYQTDRDRPLAFQYRDYVIDSFNNDKPYPQFIREQIAGDLIAPNDVEALIATGFCRMGPSPSIRSDGDRYDEIDQMVGSVTSVFLGLTIGCARCHDHPHDPFTQRDYYRLAAIFGNAVRQDVVIETALPTQNESAEAVMMLAEHAGPESNRVAMAVVGSKQPLEPVRLLYRGSPASPGPVVEPGLPETLVGPSGNLANPSRRELADWIASEQNPVTARVMINRIWQWHFGTGLVATSSDFGFRGETPTHPELLDWLAHEFMRTGWQIKAVRRWIVLSQTYRQASRTDPANAAIDPKARFLWRYPLRRLTAEAIRDTVLFASGNLNLQMYGPSVRPRVDISMIGFNPQTQWPVIINEVPEHWRRSIYLCVKRSVPIPFLRQFDAPDSSEPCARRHETVVPTQALTMWNNPFTHEQAEFMAERVEREVPGDMAAQVDRAYELTLSRRPSAAEREWCVQFVEERCQQYWSGYSEGSRPPRYLRVRALTDLCHVLFNLTEFVYLR